MDGNGEGGDGKGEEREGRGGGMGMRKEGGRAMGRVGEALAMGYVSKHNGFQK